jgi:DNA-binding GntR family transcriptional regulator
MKILKSSKKDTQSLTDRVYQELRMSVITGKIPAGTRLVESALAAQMAVSRTPIREALHKLALEGLLYSIPRAGYIVEEMSDFDIQDLFTTRMAIEQLAAKWALKKITPKELDRLEANIKKTDEVLKSGQTQKMMDLDADFHDIIYRSCRSKTLYHICLNLSDHTLKYRIACIHIPEIAARAREGHFLIMQAFQRKNAKALDSAIEEHLQQVKKDIMDYLQDIRHESFLRVNTRKQSLND